MGTSLPSLYLALWGKEGGWTKSRAKQRKSRAGKVVTRHPVTTHLYPQGLSRVFVVTVRCATCEMEARASPLKP